MRLGPLGRSDESLFLARIHPLARADQLSVDEVRRLNRAIKLVLRRAIRHRGSTLRDYVDADGAAGRFQKLHRVYDRTGDPCSACKRPIERIEPQLNTRFAPQSIIAARPTQRVDFWKQMSN